MTTNALAWFAGQSGELRESLASGSVNELALPPTQGADILVCRAPSGKTLDLPASATKAVIGPLDECGVWQVTTRVKETSASPGPNSGEPIIEFACNLASRAESDLRVPESLLKAEPVAALAAGWFTRPIWFYLVLAAWLLATVEWFLYQRRWIS